MSRASTATVAVVTGASALRLEPAIDLPRPAAGEALVEITLCGVCATDVHYFEGHLPGASPAVFGHEWMGRVRAVGPGLALTVGERVCVCAPPPCGSCASCAGGHPGHCTTVSDANRGLAKTRAAWGGFASHVLVGADRLIPIPDDVDDVSAAMLEPASVALRAVRRSNVGPGQSVVVLGGGPIGLFAAQIARHTGSEVLLVEPQATRRRIAAGLGIDRTCGPDEASALVGELSQGRGADVVMECTGLPAVLAEADAHVRDGGTVAVVGVPPGPVTFDVMRWIRHEVTYCASIAYSRDDVTDTLALLAESAIKTTGIHTRTVRLDELDPTLRQLAEGSGADCKVLVDPQPHDPTSDRTPTITRRSAP